LPFNGETFGAIAVAISHGRFPPPYAQSGIGSHALDAWFARALSVDPNGRFTSARELADTFAAACSSTETGSPYITAGTGVHARAGTGDLPAPEAAALVPPTFAGVTATLNRTRSRRVFALFALGAVVVAATITVGLFRAGSSQRAPAASSQALASQVPAPPSPAAPVVVAPSAPQPVASVEVQQVASAPASASRPAPLIPGSAAAARPRKRKPAATAAAAPKPAPPVSVPDRGF
jgi:serine/threonine-protein kinase